MFLRRIGLPVFLATLAAAILFGALSWGNAQASSPAMQPESVLRQTMPMTGTMPGPGAAGGDMPMQPGMGQSGMGQMMAHMTKMQGMMAKMQRMMAGGMMASNTPMTGTMPMAGMMQGDMGEMMAMMGEMQAMMAEMQAMMAEMQGMMSSEMMADQVQGQSMQGGMMGQMPMMGTMILIAPMPMGGMMQQTPGMNMMGQMPMMQGMNMGGMMQGMGGMMGQGAAQADAPTSASNATGEVQSDALGKIEVKVTPPDLSNIQGDTIDFTVDLNATDADLTFDLAKVATLSIGDHAMPATAWEIAYDHGHHVNGVLKFPAHMSGPVESATLTIIDPEGGESLTLTWPPVQ